MDEQIETTAQELRSLGGRVEPVRGDLRRAGDVDAPYRTATAVAPVDVVVGNAGVGQGMEDTPMGSAPKDDPADFAKQGVAAMLRGEDEVVAASATTRFQERLAGVLPDRLKDALHVRIARPGGAR